MLHPDSGPAEVTGQREPGEFFESEKNQMMGHGQLLFKILHRPGLFEQSPYPFWDDEHISGEMLKAHLDPDFDGASRKPAFLDRSAEWIASLAGPAAGKRLLDLGCGPGLYAERFCRKGFMVSGMDLSRRSIAYAKTHSDPAIHYRRADYLNADLPGEIDLATMIYCDFGVLPPESRRLLLGKIFDALKPGGCFVFDVFTRFQYAGFRETTTVTENASGGFWAAERHIVLDRRLAYPEDRTFLHQAAVVTGTGLKYYNIWEHVFTRRELEGALREAGFRTIRFYGDVSGAPASPGSKTLGVVAEK